MARPAAASLACKWIRGLRPNGRREPICLANLIVGDEVCEGSDQAALDLKEIDGVDGGPIRKIDVDLCGDPRAFHKQGTGLTGYRPRPIDHITVEFQYRGAAASLRAETEERSFVVEQLHYV